MLNIIWYFIRPDVKWCYGYLTAYTIYSSPCSNWLADDWRDVLTGLNIVFSLRMHSSVTQYCKKFLLCTNHFICICGVAVKPNCLFVEHKLARKLGLEVEGCHNPSFSVKIFHTIHVRRVQVLFSAKMFQNPYSLVCKLKAWSRLGLCNVPTFKDMYNQIVQIALFVIYEMFTED